MRTSDGELIIGWLVRHGWVVTLDGTGCMWIWQGNDVRSRWR